MTQQLFQTGSLSRGGQPVIGCANPVFRAPVVTANAGIFDCHVKLLGENAFYVESVCAWALAQMKLPAPEPMWIYVSRSVLPKKSPWPYGEAKATICFGTRTLAGATTVRHSTAYDMTNHLRNWEHFSATATFDEAIANDDRSEKNILTDGKKHWLIDHSHSFGNKYGTPGALTQETFSFTNLLFKRLAAETAAQRSKRVPEIKAACAATSEALKNIPYSLMPLKNHLETDLPIYFEARLPSLVPLCLERLGIPELSS
jgi:hypothetical protein